MSKRFALLAALLAVALVALGCGSNDDGSQAGSTGSAAEGTSESFDLSWADGSPSVLDSSKAFNTGTIRSVSPVLEGLVKLDEDGRIQPALAESVERRDATTYAYKLREGVRFSDGAPLTPEDVVYSLKRYQARDSQNSAEYENVESIAAEGDTIVVKLKEPNVTWQYVPAFAGYVVQKAHAERVGSRKLGTPGNLPIGTGPWKFDSFKPDVGLEYSPNPLWWGGETQAKRISVKFINDQPATALALRSGEADGTLNEANIKTFGNIPGVSLLRTEGPDEFFVSLPTTTAPFDDVHVRRAVAHAVNREGFVKSVLNGAGSVNDSVVPPTLLEQLASKEQVDETLAALPSYPYDIDKAKQEMAQSRYPDGFTTTTTVPSSLPEFTRLAQVLKADLEKIGIKLNIVETTDSAWLAVYYGPRDRVGLSVVKLNGLYPDANQLLSFTLDPAQARVNGLNSANFKDPRIARLILEQRREDDGAKRLDMIAEILRISNEEAAYVPIAQTERLGALSDKYVMPGYSAWAQYGPWPLEIRPAAE
jgi:peptide/nickel transport system substrate-binding protein